MTTKKKINLWFHIKGILIVTLIGASISIIFTGFSSLSWRLIHLTTIYSFLIGGSLWIGNVSINPALDRIFRKRPLTPGKKLTYSMILMALVSTSLIIFVNWFFYEIIMGYDFLAYIEEGGALFTMIIEMIVVIIVALSLFTQEFFNSWRAAVTNEEALKREKLALEYEALKNQVNPHFLFNSLNTLSGLIEKDAEKATHFVKQLADIYRYVLEHKDREIISLDTEMKFIETYVSMMKIRFGENLILKTDISEGSKLKIIPLSIQMLVENAIKHNIISAELPLTITISIKENSHLIVSNNLQRKSSVLRGDSGEWEKHGLANIKSRYEYLSQGSFTVYGATDEPFPLEIDGSFVVNVPLIK